MVTTKTLGHEVDPFISQWLTTYTRVAMGVDLGQSHDPTSIAVVSKQGAEIAAHAPMSLVPALQHAIRSIAPKYELHLLQQAPLGESYPAQATRIKCIRARARVAEHDPEVWFDYTGVGRAVYDIFRQERVPRPKPLTITFAGQAGPNGRGGHSVPKIELVSKLQALMQCKRLEMPRLPLVKTFRREVLEFNVKYTAIGNATFGAREGAHDDLVLAVAIAVYGLDRGNECSVQPLRL